MPILWDEFDDAEYEARHGHRFTAERRPGCEACGRSPTAKEWGSGIVISRAEFEERLRCEGR